ncbi:hypothetical protein HDU91_004376, partial [Kappamyces sp. JEL0680]
VFGNADRVEAAQQLFDALAHSKHLQDDVQSQSQAMVALGTVYALNGQLDKAEALFQQFQNVAGSFPVLKSSFHMALLQGYSKVGDVTQSRKHFGSFSSSPKHLRQLAFGHMMNAFAQKGLPGDAGLLYKQLLEQGLAASPRVFEGMVRSCIPSKDATLAANYFSKVSGNRLVKPSMGMYDALLQVQLAAGENLVAWKTLVASLAAFKANRTRSSRVHVPIGMARALAKDLKGKHIDYLRDRMRLSFVPLAHRGQVVAKLMYAALYPGPGEEPDAGLALALYNEIFDESGCASSSGIPTMAHINAIVAHGLQGTPDKALEIFQSMIDTSFDRELDAYNALLGALARANKKELVLKYFKDLQDNNLTPSAETWEAVLTVADPASVSEWKDQIVNGGYIPSPVQHQHLLEALSGAVLPGSLAQGL